MPVDFAELLPHSLLCALPIRNGRLQQIAAGKGQGVEAPRPAAHTHVQPACGARRGEPAGECLLRGDELASQIAVGDLTRPVNRIEHYKLCCSKAGWGKDQVIQVTDGTAGPPDACTRTNGMDESRIHKIIRCDELAMSMDEAWLSKCRSNFRAFCAVKSEVALLCRGIETDVDRIAEQKQAVFLPANFNAQPMSSTVGCPMCVKYLVGCSDG